MDFSVDLLHKMEEEMNIEIYKVLKSVNVTSAAKINEAVLMRLNKYSLAKFVESSMNVTKTTRTFAWRWRGK